MLPENGSLYPRNVRQRLPYCGSGRSSGVLFTSCRCALTPTACSLKASLAATSLRLSFFNITFELYHFRIYLSSGFCLFLIALTRKPAEPFNATQRAKLLSLVKKGKVFDRPFFKRVAGVRGQSPRKHVRRSAKSELKNNPVDCFSRGNALQERAFPNEKNLAISPRSIMERHTM